MPDVPFRRVADAAEPSRPVAVAGLLPAPRLVAADKPPGVAAPEAMGSPRKVPLPGGWRLFRGQ